ncbi:MAG: STAS domain-containing protein [Symploca sp. SIO3C6]|uniref:Anti-sigma factor antagonist n=1 Tax=Symploca sp. SIO1C4 TaxID=2607765 RepID=A0A6B3NE89_9CYAN|nr:STAS domain-containing protein [Symploca sp. SIO3C6]NER31796.1 STAS domain-containing protein [Symploca sp. SIO1C4]NET05300.1 STAS domain-containing protein [Symploca sp. SIO2B6]
MSNAIVDSQLTIVAPSGNINAANAAMLQHQLQEAMASAQTSALLVDMQQLEFLDSAGLMALVSALSLSKTLKRRFGICSVAPQIRIIFELTKLDGAFEIFESREAFAADIEGC